MFRTWVLMVGVVATLVAPPADAATRPDACKPLIPAALAQQLLKQFPSHRPPREHDSLAEDIAMVQRHGRGRCLRVALGDFDGDTVQDRAVLLTPTPGGRLMLVAALQRPGGWQIETVAIWPAPDASPYVDVAKPGHYRSRSSPAEPGEVAEVQSRWPGIASGTLEASAVVYFRQGGRWLHVWQAD